MFRYICILGLSMIIHSVVSAVGLGSGPQALINKYGPPVSGDRSGEHLGIVECTYSNRIVAGVEVQPWVSFTKPMLKDGPWICDTISYKVLSTNKLNRSTVSEILEDIQPGDWMFDNVPEVLRGTQLETFQCFKRRRSGGKSVYDKVAAGVQTHPPEVYITINYCKPKPDPAIELIENVIELESMIESMTR